ncbi:MAG TPA: hypothetical protein VNQ90_01260 [Chthoniobacteraceae bacterium]|nr:hypothetical protein [Chthoniobacteraceae bacterium]
MKHSGDHNGLVELLLQKHGRLFSGEVGVHLERAGPSALFRWLCASLLFSARISASIAAKAARALVDEGGWTTPQKMARSRWEERTHVLNASGYARYDESTSTMLGQSVDLLLDRYHGDLRELRREAHCEPARERELLREFKGIGDVGVDIFFREIQNTWDELYPFADAKALSVARKMHLGDDAKTLAGLVPRHDFPRLLSALVRCGLAKEEEALMEEAAETGRATA